MNLGVRTLLKSPFLRYRLRRMLATRPKGAPLRIVVGAHRISEPGWIPTEREALDLLRPSTWSRFFEDETIDAILAEHVWEHLTREQGLEAARTCCRFLKPGGYIRLAVPDGFHPDPRYIERVRIGGTGPAAWDHKVLYDYRTISAVFANAGFEVDLLEYFDEQHAFHTAAWDAGEGLIHRSSRFDRRNRDKPLAYTSLIIDATKPVAEVPIPMPGAVDSNPARR